METKKRKIIDLSQEEIEKLVDDLLHHGDEIFCRYYGISTYEYEVDKPQSMDEISKEMNLPLKLLNIG